MTSWTAASIDASKTFWQTTLTARDKAELRAAIDAYTKSQKPLEALTKHEFNLPTLGQELADLFEIVNDGLGIATLKGLPLDEYSEREAIIAALGISSYFGNFRPQPPSGMLMYHVYDFQEPRSLLLSTTNQQGDMHVDSCDIVSLTVLQTASKGGEGFVVSTEAIKNEMKKQRPELYEALCQPLAYDRRTTAIPGQDSWYMLPVFNVYKGKQAISFNKQYHELAMLNSQAPRPSALQQEGLVVFKELCESPKFKHPALFERGDMQFLNNLTTAHSRNEYHDDPNKKRHLLRLWMSHERSRELPAEFSSRWMNIIPGQRGGVQTSQNNQIVPTLAEASAIISKP
jgi:hypothetical protein